MHDKILGFIRETMLHENLVDSLSVDLCQGEVRLNLLQPELGFHQYPDPELLLTFSGVREFLVRGSDEGICLGESIIEMGCTAQGHLYQARITVGDSSKPYCFMNLKFADLRYKRSRPG